MAPSRKGKKKLNKDVSQFQKEQQEIIHAAETLLMMKDDKNFDPEDLRKAMKGKNVIKEAGSSRSSKLSKPEFVGNSIDGTKLPRLPPIENLQGIIGICSEPFEKMLTKSDFHRQARLLLANDDVEKALLPLLNDKENGDLAKTGIKVNTFDLSGNSYPMTFMSYRNTFYIYKGWKKFLKGQEWKGREEDYYVTVWMFRHKETKKLCFTLDLKRYDNNTATD